MEAATVRERSPTEIRCTNLGLNNHSVATASSRSRLRLGLSSLCRSRFWCLGFFHRPVRERLGPKRYRTF